MINGLISHLDTNASQTDSLKRKPTLIDVNTSFDVNTTANDTASDQPDCSSWDIYNSFFFAFTTITTIGELSNDTWWGELQFPLMSLPF
jgi:hypothetical protein